MTLFSLLQNLICQFSLMKPLTFSEHFIPSRKLRSTPFVTGVEPGAFRPGSDSALFVDVHLCR